MKDTLACVPIALLDMIPELSLMHVARLTQTSLPQHESVSTALLYQPLYINTLHLMLYT